MNDTIDVTPVSTNNTELTGADVVVGGILLLGAIFLGAAIIGALSGGSRSEPPALPPPDVTRVRIDHYYLRK